MVKEKQGKRLRLSRINKRLFWNHLDAMYSIPLIRSISPYTMLSFTALYQVRKHLETLAKERIAGAIVEMGCWKGGCGAFMARVSECDGMERGVWLFDSFEGLPQLTTEDTEWAKKLEVTTVPAFAESSIRPIGLYKASETDAREALIASGYAHVERVHLVKGWFQDSVPRTQNDLGPIALLRLDGDTYESTKYCLEKLYGQVVSGGFVVIDDFNLQGCRQALFEFFATHQKYPEIRLFPYGGRLYWRK